MVKALDIKGKELNVDRHQLIQGVTNKEKLQNLKEAVNQLVF